MIYIFFCIWTSFLWKAPCCILIHGCYSSYHISVMLICPSQLYTNFNAATLRQFQTLESYITNNYFSRNIIIISQPVRFSVSLHRRIHVLHLCVCFVCMYKDANSMLLPSGWTMYCWVERVDPGLSPESVC